MLWNHNTTLELDYLIVYQDNLYLDNVTFPTPFTCNVDLVKPAQTHNVDAADGKCQTKPKAVLLR